MKSNTFLDLCSTPCRVSSLSSISSDNAGICILLFFINLGPLPVLINDNMFSPLHHPKKCANAGCTTSNLDLDQVLEEVFDAKAKWKFIGLKLGVPKGELDAI